MGTPNGFGKCGGKLYVGRSRQTTDQVVSVLHDKLSEVSMMPEQLEKQITPQELADLFSYLALDKPPSDPKAKYLPGYPRGK